MGYLGQGNETVPIYLSLYSRRLPIHLQEDKDNCLIFLAFSLLDNKSLSIILMIELFLCNKYLSFFYHGSGQFFCVLVGCVCFFVGASASDSPSSFLFFNLFFFFCSSCCLSSFWVVCLLVLVFFPLLLFFFLFLCFLLFITYVILLFLPLFPASLHVSRVIVLVVVVLVIIPPLSQLVFLLLPSPPRAFEQESNGLRNKSFCCLSGILAKMSFHRIIVFFLSVVDFFHPQNMFLFHVLGLSFEGVRDSLLLHICFCCVWCLAHNLLSVQLVSCACILWIRCLLCSSSSFFCVSACVVFLLWVLVCFLSILVVILGLSFLDCSVLMLFLLLNVLSARLCVGGFWAAFWGEPSRKVVWVWHTGRGQYIFRVFS